jgi:carbon storage regulator
MLILSRRESECIHLGDDIVLTIVRVSGEKVRIGVEAPPHVKILRNELEVSQAKENDVAQQVLIASPPIKHSITQTDPAGPVAEIPVAKVVRKVPIQVRRAA